MVHGLDRGCLAIRSATKSATERAPTTLGWHLPDRAAAEVEPRAIEHGRLRLTSTGQGPRFGKYAITKWWRLEGPANYSE
jgi:hypothetical protein